VVVEHPELTVQQAYAAAQEAMREPPLIPLSSEEQERRRPPPPATLLGAIREPIVTPEPKLLRSRRVIIAKVRQP
jgi:hypothetical protein